MNLLRVLILYQILLVDPALVTSMLQPLLVLLPERLIRINTPIYHLLDKNKPRMAQKVRVNLQVTSQETSHVVRAKQEYR